MHVHGRPTRRPWALVVPLVGVWIAPAPCWAEPLDDCRLSVHWKVLANHGQRFDAELTLSNAGQHALPAAGWRIYFNSARLLTLDEARDSVKLRHVNGDFFELSPSRTFGPLAAGASRTFGIKGAHWAIKESDCPAGFYLVRHDEAGRPRGDARPLRATIAPFVTPQQTARSAGDNLPVPTPASRYASYPPLEPVALSAHELVVPTPVSAVPQPGKVRIDSSTVVAYAPGLKSTASLLSNYFREDVAIDVKQVAGLRKGRNVIRLQIAPVGAAGRAHAVNGESYTLKINEHEGVDVTGQGAAGVFYGVQSLRALLPVEAFQSRPGAVSVDGVVIRDAPRFVYRGLHLDVARNFHGVETVKKLLDAMAFYKLNRFHWHLTDDEGWRLQINAYPELTAMGGRRGHTTDESDRLVPSFGSGPAADSAMSAGSGYYTQDQFIDILRYAHARHIEVIPEFDFPGHARAAIVSLTARSRRLRQGGDAKSADGCLLVDPLDESKYESVQLWRDNVVDVGLESAYHVLEAIFDEVISLYRRAESPLATIHIGGDEVPEGAWQKSPACVRLVSRGVVNDLERRTLHAYFVRRLAKFLSGRGLRTGCWEECVLAEEERDGKIVKRPKRDSLNQNITAYVWNNVWGWGQEDVAYQLANAGYDVVLSSATNLYFDLAYDKDPREPGYYWAGFVDERKPFDFIPLDFYKNARADALGNPLDPATYANRPRLTDAGARRIRGIQGQLWSETLTTRARLEFAAFPKVIALAERAWAREPAWATLSDAATRQAELEKDWQRFANRLGQRELPRLDYLAGGMNYRIPPPGAAVVNGAVQANVAYPGFKIRYTTNGAAPTTESPVYDGAIEAKTTIKLKAFSPAGRSGRTTTVRP